MSESQRDLALLAGTLLLGAGWMFMLLMLANSW